MERDPNEELSRGRIAVRKYPGQWGESGTQTVDIPILRKQEMDQMEFEIIPQIVNEVYSSFDSQEKREFESSLPAETLNSQANTQQVSGKQLIIRKAIKGAVEHPNVKPKLVKDWYLRPNYIKEVAKLVANNYGYGLEETENEIYNIYGK